MWALRCLPLRNRVLRASCFKSVSATWVEDDSGTLESSKRVLTRDEDFRSNFRLPVSDLSPSHMSRVLRASCFKSVSAAWVEDDSGTLESFKRAPNTFYRSWHASLNFAVSRRQLSGSTKDQDDLEDGKDESNDKESDKMDKWVEEGKIPVYIPWKGALVKYLKETERLIDEHVRFGRKDKAEYLLREMELSFLHKHPSTIANILLQYHAKLDNIDEVRRICKVSQSLDEFVVCAAAFPVYIKEIHEHIMFGRREEAEELLREMEVFFLQRTPPRVGLRRFRSVCHHVAFHLLRYHAKLRNRNDVQRIWEAYKAISPTLPIVCETALKSFVRLRKFNEAEEVCEILSKPFMMSSYSMPLMFYVYASQDRLEKSRDIFLEMVANKDFIPPIIWHHLINLHVKFMEIEEAEIIFQKAVMNGARPTQAYYNAIKKHYAKRGGRRFRRSRK